MSDKTGIEWTDATWNPVRGCTKISAGCRNCYAEKFAERWRGVPGHPFEQGFDIRLVPEMLDLPLRWKKPRRIFVNSMSDLFHKDIPDSFILKVFDVMRRAHWHTFQVLTKRADRMFRLAAGWRFDSASGESWFGKTDGRPDFALLRNVQLGVSVEDQRAADERILFLLKAPAAVRFISGEPLLGAVNLRKIVPEDDELGVGYDALTGALCGNAEPGGPRIDWVICGGESGPGARVWGGFEDAARSLRDQCRSAGVAFFMKQMAGPIKAKMPPIPQDLMVREFPHAT